MSNNGQFFCYCQINAALHTVKKEGKDKGRLFANCIKFKTNPTRCRYFKWLSASKKKNRFVLRDLLNPISATEEEDEKTVAMILINLGRIVQ